MAELDRRYSPYIYGNSNPIRFIDPDGMMAWASEVMKNAASGVETNDVWDYSRSETGNQTNKSDPGNNWLQRLLAKFGIGRNNSPKSSEEAEQIAANNEVLNKLTEQSNEADKRLSEIPVLGGLYQLMKNGVGTLSNEANYFAAGMGLASAGFDIAGGVEVAGAFKSLTQLGLKDGVKRTSGEVLELAQKFLGKGYKEVSPGSGRFISADGRRLFRMGERDILGKHGGGPHVNFETFVPNPKKPGKLMVKDNYHVYLSQ